jgi:hypothetical protein
MYRERNLDSTVLEKRSIDSIARRPETLGSKSKSTAIEHREDQIRRRELSWKSGVDLEPGGYSVTMASA